jgi:hypothetical protein
MQSVGTCLAGGYSTLVRILCASWATSPPRLGANSRVKLGRARKGSSAAIVIAVTESVGDWCGLDAPPAAVQMLCTSTRCPRTRRRPPPAFPLRYEPPPSPFGASDPMVNFSECTREHMEWLIAQRGWAPWGILLRRQDVHDMGGDPVCYARTQGEGRHKATVGIVVQPNAPERRVRARAGRRHRIVRERPVA